MGANCCKGHKEAVNSVQVSELTLADLEERAADLPEMTVEKTRDVAETSEQRPPIPTLTPSAIKIFDNDHPRSQEETSNTKESPRNLGQDEMSLAYSASNILWSTGSFSDPIPNGFYSVIPDKRLKLSKSIPTLDEIPALGLMDDVILIDFEKDQKYCRLKDYTIKVIGGWKSKPVTVIKKIAELLRDFYKQSTLQSSRKTTKSIESHGYPLLGQVKRGCRARAIFFKVLADLVGLESRLVLGFPSDLKSPASVNTYNHMSVVVVLNTVEMLVDLVRCPGQLIPLSPKAFYLAHNPSAALPISVNNDSFDSDGLMHGYMDNAVPSESGPNIATESRRRKLFKEQSITSSSCKSDGEAKSETKGKGKNTMKAPNYSDNIARAMLLMKQSQSFRDRGNDDSSPQNYQSQSYRTGGPSSVWNEVPLLPYEEWNIDPFELTVGPRIGSGSFGIVYRGMWNDTEVAIKMLLGGKLTAENKEDFCNEMSILSRLRHPNVILFLGACTKPPQLSVVTEYMESGSLFELIHTRKKEIKLGRKLSILRDICRGLMYIHRMGIVHCDLKSTNCLLSNKGMVKICDFGLSRMIKGKTVEDTEAAGTPAYMAPELIRDEACSEKCDIFSFGVIMWELCTLSKPWEGVSTEKVIHAVANGALLKIPEGPLSSLIADCWSKPEQRPSCKDIQDRLLLALSVNRSS